MIALKCLEDEFFKRGYTRIAGADEAGRGALAGPLVAAACMMEPKSFIGGVKDSKKLTPSRRASLYKEICESCLAYAVEIVEAEEIDRIGIQKANLNALEKAIGKLDPEPEYSLCDYYRLNIENSLSMVRGESRSYNIACASIIAKVERDNIMEAYEHLFPGYGFVENKGYGTKQHLEAIVEYGISALHRKSFKMPAQKIMFG